MQLNVRTHYPVSTEYEYETILERINLDDERINDIYNNNGFIVTSSKPIKDDIKDPNGIFSQKFGQTLQDKEPFGNRYRCKCGMLTKRINEGEICRFCGTPVTFMDDNFEYFAWMPLHDPYHIIHPNLFMTLTFFIGEKIFHNIIRPDMKKDEDGNDLHLKRPKDEPFYGIGMMEFYDRFDEIIAYYVKKNPAKKDYYTDIMENREKIFIQSIPVYTIHLRPFRVEGHSFHFEGTNARFNIMNKLVHTINNDKLMMNRKGKPKNELLYDLQVEYMKLYDEIGEIIKGKKGSLRSLFGGRYLVMAIIGAILIIYKWLIAENLSLYMKIYYRYGNQQPK